MSDLGQGACRRLNRWQVHWRTRVAYRIAPWLTIRVSKPTRADAEHAMAVARERGWLTDEGWRWDFAALPKGKRALWRGKIDFWIR